LTGERGKGLTPEALSSQYPRLYHMADAANWEGMQRHGLLSTTALLDLFEICGAQREAIEARRRPESVTITHPVHGAAVIRDQKPMDDSGLRRALRDGLSPADWYRVVNRKVFFWVSESRLQTLLGARAYRSRRHIVCIVDTARLLERHSDRVTLSPMNSGATKPIPHPRGRDTFLTLGEYPFAERVRRRLQPLVELAVEYSVPDVLDLLVGLQEAGAGRPARSLEY
jgi:hypothetical protein